METLKGEHASFESIKDLKLLLSSNGPCVTVYMPVSAAGVNHNARQNELHWKESLRALEPLVPQYGPEVPSLVSSISSWGAVTQNQEPAGKAIAVFRSSDVFCVTSLDEPVKDRVDIGPRFYIRPLLLELVRAKTFYLLALSQNKVRLLRCASGASEEVSLPAETKTGYAEWMNMAKPDHASVYGAAAGASAGSSRGALASWATIDEAKNEYLSHFFRQIDRGVNEALRGHSEPLMLCAVDYELALYNEMNSYPHLAKEAVHGAPDAFKGGEMHTRAIEALRRCYDDEINGTLAEWNHKVGGGASSRLKEVVTAAHDGRVLTLLASDFAEKTGTFDETTHTVKGKETGGVDDEDLVNAAAAETILHGGRVLVVPHNKMPNGSALAAIYRF